MSRVQTGLIVLLLFALCPPGAYGVRIDCVPVGNSGNEGEQSRLARYQDPSYYGGVGYVYSIGKYEVTSEQYTEFLNAVAARDTYGLYNINMWSSVYGCKIERSGTWGDYSYTVADNRADRPVNYVSWGDAARFANWLHNGQPTGEQDNNTTEDGAYALFGANDDAALMAITRKSSATWFLPTDNEWYKAAYHKNDGVTGNYFDYPTSSDSVPSNDLVDPDSGNNANFADGGYTIGDPYWTTPVGQFTRSGSPYGTFDQGGNLWEWNETAVDDSKRGMRGGTWNSFSGFLPSSARINGDPTIDGYYLGFRVATAPIPEPGSVALLVCGLLTGLMWWRHRK